MDFENKKLKTATELAMKKVESNEEKEKNAQEINEDQLEFVAKKKIDIMEKESQVLKKNEGDIKNTNKIGLEPGIFNNIREKFKLDEKLSAIYQKGKDFFIEAREDIKDLLEKFMEEKKVDGKLIKEMEEKDKKTSVSSEEKTRVCPQCGKEAPFGHNFCNCGAELRFNPEVEIKKIRTGSKEEQKQKLVEFKEKLINQKKGIAIIQNKLIGEIMKNPDLTRAEYGELVETLEDDYDLSYNQQTAIKRGLERYITVHTAIKENVSDCLNPESGEVDAGRLYEKLFQRKPIGRVEVMIRPAMIYFRAENIDDYAYVDSGAFIQGAEVDEVAKMKAQNTGGATVSRFPIKELEKAIVIENASNPGQYDNKNSIWSREVMEHEEQHVISFIVDEGYNAENDKFAKKINKRRQDLAREDKGVSDQEKTEMINEITTEWLAKGEIVSYFRTGNSASQVKNALLKPETIYKYGYSYKNKDSNSQNFSQEYVDLVTNGVDAYAKLLRSGYSQPEAQALIYNEPLSKWPKVVERLNLPSLQEKFEKLKSDPDEYVSKMWETINKIRDLRELDEVLNDIHDITIDFKTGSGSFGHSIIKKIRDYIDSGGNEELLGKIPDVYGLRMKALELQIMSGATKK